MEKARIMHVVWNHGPTTFLDLLHCTGTYINDKGQLSYIRACAYCIENGLACLVEDTGTRCSECKRRKRLCGAGGKRECQLTRHD